MTDKLSIALSQINPVVGDVAGNVARILAAREKAHRTDLIIFPELTISGYPPEDIVLVDKFIEKIRSAVDDLAKATLEAGPAMLIGAPWKIDGKRTNAAIFLYHGSIKAIQAKHHLPNYDVFDEVRLFTPGPIPNIIQFRGLNLGILICEDMWLPDICQSLTKKGADLLIAINASPFDANKEKNRLHHACQRAKETRRSLIYVNQVGGQDELVFDGSSFIVDSSGNKIISLASWQEEILVTNWQKSNNNWICQERNVTSSRKEQENLYQAMMLGLRDYVKKNNFPSVLIGLSGGIDSALTAAIAVDALGAEMVHCVMMPSPYTSKESLDDAAEVSRFLGIGLDNINIKPAMDAFDAMLSQHFQGMGKDTTEENIQARSRGMILMAMSNKSGSLLLTTGNKSEMSVGYATLYGDMCGGFSVLKDLYKTGVFALSRWRNCQKPEQALGPAGMVMPERVITKPPTAELKPGQTDQDSLPPYAVLDEILELLIEQRKVPDEISPSQHDPDIVKQVYKMLNRAEYKRRQSPPGVKLTPLAFGRDRRYPIVNGFTG